MASAANIGLLAWRDSVFAREFSGPGGKDKPKTPMRTVGLFAIRDSATMAATFYVAPKACDYLVWEKDWNRHTAEIQTSFIIPVVSQFITAPLHIHAIDYFNRPVATREERIAEIKKEMGKICFARGLRILPAFGIGAYSNNKFRELTIRQPNEDLLLTTKLTKKFTQIQRSMTRRSSSVKTN
jgi:hypothetical protein